MSYDIFAPLWAIVELGAVKDSGASRLSDVSLADFAEARRETLDRLLEVAGELVGIADDRTARDTSRMRHVACRADRDFGGDGTTDRGFAVPRPASTAPEAGKRGFRACRQALDELLASTE